jgi:hypothetical protein
MQVPYEASQGVVAVAAVHADMVVCNTAVTLMVVGANSSRLLGPPAAAAEPLRIKGGM